VSMRSPTRATTSAGMEGFRWHAMASRSRSAAARRMDGLAEC